MELSIPEDSLGGTIFFMGRKRSVPMLFNACHHRMLRRNTGQNIRIMGLTPVAATFSANP
jgi:hypothetical protein